MRYLGIDFGKKRIGLALSDTDGVMAFPKGVIPNDRRRMIELKSICDSQKVEVIVLGESKDYGMQDNKIMKDILLFKKELEWNVHVPIEMEPEFMTSAQAEHMQEGTGMLDAAAATIILQSYLDKQKN